MADGKISDFLEMQRILAETKGWMNSRNPDHAPMSLLWSIEELGEAIAIIKKKGGDAIMDNPSVRSHFTEECADVFMYLFDMFLSYGITAEEFTDAYTAKFRKNMGRDWHENNAMYESCRWKLVIFDSAAAESVSAEKLSAENISAEEDSAWARLTEILSKIGVDVAVGDNPAEISEKSGIAPEFTVVCTSSPEKITEAKKSGMTCVAVSETPVEYADSTIPNLSALPDFLCS